MAELIKWRTEKPRRPPITVPRTTWFKEVRLQYDDGKKAHKAWASTIIAASKCRMCAGPCLSAHLPPATAAARMESVGVRHAATARDETR